jgi:Flp pilus assembly protein TadD
LTWFIKGNALLYKQGKYDEAIKAYNKAIEINPKYAKAWNNKGIALNKLGRTAEANAAKTKAKELGYKGQ